MWLPRCATATPGTAPPGSPIWPGGHLVAGHWPSGERCVSAPLVRRACRSRGADYQHQEAGLRARHRPAAADAPVGTHGLFFSGGVRGRITFTKFTMFTRPGFLKLRTPPVSASPMRDLLPRFGDQAGTTGAVQNWTIAQFCVVPPRRLRGGRQTSAKLRGRSAKSRCHRARLAGPLRGIPELAGRRLVSSRNREVRPAPRAAAGLSRSSRRRG